MTTSTDVPAVVRDICERAELPTDGLKTLRHHSTGVYLLPHAPAVLRLSPAVHADRQRTALAVTRWILDHDVAVTEPLDLDQPLIHNAHVATLWRYYPQTGRPAPPAHHLGSLLRRIHRLGAPPMDLPRYKPLASLGQALSSSPSLAEEDRTWLLQRRRELLDAYANLDFPLGHGLLHGDAYPGNTLWHNDTVLLGDWDECAQGPRELDLANTLHGNRRFGRTDDAIEAFLRTYGHDLRSWPGLPVLLDLRDLHTLGSFIRRADTGDQQAAAQMAYRITTLKHGDTTANWLQH